MNNNGGMLIGESLSSFDFALNDGGTTLQYSERDNVLNGDDTNQKDESLLHSSVDKQDVSKPYRIIFKGVLVHD